MSTDAGPDAGPPPAKDARSDPGTADEWRGLAAEDDDADTVSTSTGLRLQRRARTLVGQLVAPHRRAVVLAAVLLVLENVVMLAGPLLVAVAIDVGVPAAIEGDLAPLAWSIAGFAAAGLAGAGLRAAFLVLSGRVGQDLLLDLRRRVFAHGQRLSLDFH